MDFDLNFLNVPNWWRQWPPLPPVEGLLGKPGYAKEADFSKPREDWGIKEWKAYAIHLERHGAIITSYLVQTKNELDEKRNKLSRKKPIKKFKPGLLASILAGKPTQPRRRGRPPKPDSDIKIFARVIVHQSEKYGNNFTKIINDVINSTEFKRETRAFLSKKKRSILNEISRINKLNKSQKSQKSQKFKSSV